MSLRTGVTMIGVLLSATSVSAFAASFEVPRNFQIMYVDLKSPGSFGGDFKTEIEAGPHQFVVRYNQRVGSGSDGEQFQSQPYIIDLDVPQDAKIVLKAPNIFQKSDAEQFAKKPEFSLIDETRNTEPQYKLRMLPAQNGMQVLRDYKAEVREFTQADQKANVQKLASEETAADASQALEMMKLLYNKASKEDQKAFKIWLINE